MTDVAVAIANTKIEMVSIDDLKTHPDNPRQGDLDAVRESIRSHGFFGVLVVQLSTHFILAGNHRFRGGAAEGMREFPVAWLDVDDEEARRILIADNRTSDLATNDDQVLANLLSELRTTQRGLEGTGYGETDLDELLRSLRPPTQADLDHVPEPPETPFTNPGDLWLLGSHRLLCGDSTSTDDIDLLMDGELADLVWTDPPYGVAYSGGQASDRKQIHGDHDASLYGAVLPQIYRSSKPKAALYLFFAGSHGGSAYMAVDGAGYEVRNLLMWNKLNPHYGAFMSQYMQRSEPFLYCHKRGKSPTWVGPTNEVSVWDIEQPARNELHPTQKPVELAARAIRNSSRGGAIVLDLFGGSGTVLIASEDLGRSARLMEKDPVYADVICRRYEEMTGTVPILESSGSPHSFAA